MENILYMLYMLFINIIKYRFYFMMDLYFLAVEFFILCRLQIMYVQLSLIKCFNFNPVKIFLYTEFRLGEERQ